MNQFHFLGKIKAAFFMTAGLSVIVGTAYFLIPKYFIYAQPESMAREIPMIAEFVEESELFDMAEGNLNIWIENNMEVSIRFYTDNVTNDLQISRAIVENSIKNDLPVNLAFSVAFKESKYDKKAYNDNGSSRDRGLFQLNDSYRQEWTVEDFYNIDKNSFEGTRYLKEMIQLNDEDIQKALYCYNAGPTKVRRYGIVPERTVSYAAEILEFEKDLDEQLKSWIKNGNLPGKV